MKEYRTFYIFILVFTSVILADTSIFSGSGIGEFNPNSRFKASTAVYDSTSLSSENKAVWADIINMTYSVSLDYRNYDLEALSGSNNNYDDFKVSGFNLAVPFGEKNVIGLSLKPITYIDYLYKTDFIKDSVNNNSFEDISSQNFVSRHGSINSISLSYSKKISNYAFSLGFGTIFGYLERELRTTFKNNDEVNSFDDAFYESMFRNNIYHLTFDAGFRYKVNDNFSIGAQASIPFRKMGEESYTFTHYYYAYSSSGYRYLVEDEITKNDGIDIEDIDWPAYLTVGAAYNHKGFNLAFDFKYAGFNGMNIGFAKKENEELSNYYALAFEANYRHSFRRLVPYYQKIKYSTGFTYEKLADKSSIINCGYYNDLAVSTFKAGLELPYNNEMSHVGFNFYYSLKGDNKENYFEEKILKFEMVLSGSNNWWLRKQRYND